MNIHPPQPQQKMTAPLPETVPFSFDSPEGRILGRGPARALPRGNADTLAERVGQALANGAADEVIGGALPFERGGADCLWQCPADRGAHVAAPARNMPLADLLLTPEPTAHDYARAVSRALDIMAEENGAPDALQKIVLARSLLLEAAAPIPVEALMARLGADDSITAFRVALPPVPETGPDRVLCGATPELLVAKTGAHVVSHPLAGSARRHDDPRLDRAAADSLDHSGKDHREHDLVVEAILDTLAPYCDGLTCPEGTHLTSTRSMWHLGTRIEGRLKDADTPSVLLASALHPTPAVCGVPRDRAAGFIRALEPVARDFYAGAVGWCDARGDGSWHVAIRCAEIAGRQARLYAGAGIVPGSDPMGEAVETGAKFGALLVALGLPADAGLAGITPRNKDAT